MITADQLVAHLVGDYVLQSDWMANRKRSSSFAAFVHAFVYGLCFLPFVFVGGIAGEFRWPAWFLIVYSHFLIDRYGLARYVVWAKNFLAPRWLMVDVYAYNVPCRAGGEIIGSIPKMLTGARPVRNLPWSECQATGYPPERPAWLAVWLLIIADNVLHILINGAALRFL